ncbi:sensor histidine kinase [Nocardioides guangzhouensis]|uniref:histidine kinase n=1 Tax=Nocardioides guangzhouensis TaxID=2497878 RepID=A0A4Q4ZK78_9ACTN|nr:sensor histidine kinase [Nocardioides guangzhouensis]RYP88428.1 sensor histidine kinase [Nocardioides guangzhouensis]
MTTARRGTVAPLVAGAATVLCAGTTIVLLLLTDSGVADWLAGNQANQWLGGLCLGLTGALVLHAEPRNLLGPLMSAAGTVALVSAIGFQVADLADPGTAVRGVAAWCGSVLWLPPFLTLLAALPLLFPDGRLRSPRWRWPAYVAATAGAVAVVSFATSQYALDDSDFADVHNPLDLPVPDSVQVAVATAGILLCLLVGLAGVVGLFLAMRAVGAPQRARYAWFVASLLLGAAASFLPVPDWTSFLLTIAAYVALGVGIVRYRLFDIEVALSRAVVYGTLTLLALGVYFVAVAALGTGADGGLLPALLTAVAALLLAGGRQRLQRWVDHAMYGDRDPDRALAALGDRLGSTMDPDDVLPATVEAVRASFHLPWAAVRLSGEEAPAYASGERPEGSAEFPLAHAGEDVGVLEVGLRRGERTLSDADTAALTAFARQAAVAAHGVRATREVRRSRERIVVAREEERSRIRRDLHDGLGPALAGISLGLETASRSAAGTPRAAEMLDDLRQDTTACVDDIRRIVADLRPPALDNDGLMGALRTHAEHLTARTGGTLQVRIGENGWQHRLPPAVEVAAYRIATEAMTNTARHAAARHCEISCHHDEEHGRLHLEIADDGTGAPPARPGTGLTSMRERAEELGGTCMVVFRVGSGTRVVADLPCAGAGAS